MEDQVRELFRRIRAPFDRAHAQRVLAAFHARQRPLEELVERALSFGTRGLYRVKTLQVRWEITELARRVHDLAPRTILEIGTARGGTLLIWANLAKEKVVSCDIQMPPELAELFVRFAPPASSCSVRLVVGDTHSDETRRRVVAELGGAPVDFLFIDGDHTEAGVERDYEMYRSMVRPGGLIAFHDIVQAQPRPHTHVHAFWKRLRERAAVEELIGDPGQVGYGIGVVKV